MKYENKVSEDGKYLDLIREGYGPIIQYDLEDKTFSSFRLSDFPGEVLLDFFFFVVDYTNTEFTIHNVKNYAGYVRETFSSRGRAEEYLRANDKGDKDLCISSEVVNKKPFDFKMYGVNSGRSGA